VDTTIGAGAPANVTVNLPSAPPAGTLNAAKMVNTTGGFTTTVCPTESCVVVLMGPMLV
jgi:hypothetical protein